MVVARWRAPASATAAAVATAVRWRGDNTLTDDAAAADAAYLLNSSLTLILR